MKSVLEVSEGHRRRTVRAFVAAGVVCSVLFGLVTTARAQDEAQCAEFGGAGLDPSGACRVCGEDDYGDYTVPNYWDGLESCYGPDGVPFPAGTITSLQ